LSLTAIMNDNVEREGEEMGNGELSWSGIKSSTALKIDKTYINTCTFSKLLWHYCFPRLTICGASVNVIHYFN